MPAITNRLKEIIQSHYRTTKFLPTEDMLELLNMSQARFLKIYKKQANPTFEETFALVEYFKIGFFDLAEPTEIDFNTTKIKQRVLKRHNA